jgi:hypothetical protein
VRKNDARYRWQCSGRLTCLRYLKTKRVCVHRKTQIPTRTIYKTAKRMTPTLRMVFALELELLLDELEIPMMVRTRATAPMIWRRRNSLLWLKKPSGVWNLW